MRPGHHVLDIGANIGNHAIFFINFLRAATVVVVEPNPPAIDILHINIDLNQLRRFTDTSFLGIGLSDRHALSGAAIPHRNLGGTTLYEAPASSGASIPLVPGDDLFKGRRFDFIKLDVEGMELGVLNGLSLTITANRPILFVEVDDKNHDAFLAWVSREAYTIAEQFRRYVNNKNFLLVPAERRN